jgi:hypothetical protein
MYWIDSYLGLLDLITSNTSKNFVSKEFKEYTTIIGIRTKAVPVEAHNSISIVVLLWPYMMYLLDTLCRVARP